MTYAPAPAQRIFPSRTWYREGLVVLGGATMLTMLAQVYVPMAPVPIAGQTLGVLLLGGLLGFNRGIAAVMLYLAAGTAGAPVFAGWSAGAAVFAGPDGGYLVGFLGSAGIAGLLAEHGFLRGFWSALLGMLVAALPTFAIGLAWLSFYVPAGSVLELGFWPLLPATFAALVIAGSVRRSGRALPAHAA